MQTQQTFLSKYKSLLILSLDFVFMLVFIIILKTALWQILLELPISRKPM